MLAIMMGYSIWAWVGFNGFILLMLLIDLPLHRNAMPSLREATIWSVVWTRWR